MAALTDNKEVDRKDGVLIAHKVAASTTIYKGALLKVNASGYAEPCATEAGASFIGVAYEEVDNSSGSDGDKEVRVYKTGTFLLEGSGFAQSDVGAPVYASDDQTITTTPASNLQIVGEIVEYEAADEVWVKLFASDTPAAASVAALGATADFTALAVTATNLTALAVTATNLTALAVTATNLTDLSTGDTYTDAAVNAIFAEVETALDLKADNADVETLRGEVETALDLKADNADVETLRTECETAFDLKADNADVETLRGEVETRMDNAEAKADEIIAALKGAGLMKS